MSQLPSAESSNHRTGHGKTWIFVHIKLQTSSKIIFGNTDQKLSKNGCFMTLASFEARSCFWIYSKLWCFLWFLSEGFNLFPIGCAVTGIQRQGTSSPWGCSCDVSKWRQKLTTPDSEPLINLNGLGARKPWPTTFHAWDWLNCVMYKHKEHDTQIYSKYTHMISCCGCVGNVSIGCFYDIFVHCQLVLLNQLVCQ